MKMQKITTLFFMSFLLIFTACKNENNTSKNEKLIPLEDFFKNPEKTGYQISPDGTYYSYLAPYKDRLNVFIQKIGDENAVRVTGSADRDISGYFWTNNSRILYLKDNGGDENYKLFGVNIDGTDSACYTDFDKVRTRIIDNLEEIPNEIIIGLNKRDNQVFDAYRLYLDSGKLDMIAENPGNIQGWMTDHAGKLRIAIAIVDGVNKELLYRENENEKFERIMLNNFKESFSPLFFTFDDKNLYGSSNIGRDKNAIVEFNLKTKEEKVLYEHTDYDVYYASYSKKRKVLVAASYTGVKRERFFFDEEFKKTFERIQNELKGYEVAVTGFNKEEDKFIVRTYSDRSLGAYYFYGLKTDKLEKITDVSPWLDEKEMAEVTPIEFKSRDGMTIHGYLTLPKGMTLETAKNLPTIINPHGGPWARDSWGFNPEAQFYANRGYAVLQMNFRGSVGYGRKFWEASFKKWGQEMQNDVTDGTKWLIEKGIADSKRVAILGGSYGGYATLMGLIREPELYACGIDYVGVSNLFTFMKTIPPYWKPMLDMMYEMVGNPQTDSLMFVENSPVYNADKIKAPLMVAQGANDPRVNKDESDQMVEAMKKRNIDVEYLVKDNEGHGFRNEENRFEYYRKSEEFLKKYLANKKE